MTRSLVTLGLALGVASLSISCMDTRTASLGLEAQREPGVAPDAATPAKRDAAASVTDGGGTGPQVDAAGDTVDPDGEHEEGAHDAVDADTGGDADDDSDSGADGGHSPAVIDAGAVPPPTADARVADASAAHDARDGGREDARTPVNPLCIAEPWHCQ